MMVEMTETENHTNEEPNLPILFHNWFLSKGWQIYDHQQTLISHFNRGNSCLLIAPTGSGKTLCGFLPSLIALSKKRLKTQYKPKLQT